MGNTTMRGHGMDTDGPNPAAEQLATGTHGPDGTFIRTLDQAERDAEAARLRSRSLTYRTIAAQMGVSVSTAHEMVQRALAAVVREPAQSVIQMELDKLDRLERSVLGVLERKHLTVSHGKVVELNGEPLEDDGPVVTAARELRAISESRRKLLGLDAAQKLDLSGGVKYEIVGIDPEDLG